MKLLRNLSWLIFVISSVISIFNVPTDGIIFEEVTNRGYHIQFEKTGLNFEQSVMALQKLACFHAVSAFLMSDVRQSLQSSEIFENYKWVFQFSDQVGLGSLR